MDNTVPKNKLKRNSRQEKTAHGNRSGNVKQMPALAAALLRENDTKIKPRKYCMHASAHHNATVNVYSHAHTGENYGFIYAVSSSHQHSHWQ